MIQERGDGGLDTGLAVKVVNGGQAPDIFGRAVGVARQIG